MAIRTLTFDASEKSFFDDCANADGIRDAIRRLNAGELRIGVLPSISRPVTKNVRVPPDVEKALAVLSKSHAGTSIPKLIVMLLLAQEGNENKAEADPAEQDAFAFDEEGEPCKISRADTSLMAVNGQTPSKEQVYLFEHSLAAMGEKKIPLCEAATGTGKGRVIAATAGTCSQDGRVVIAAPSYAILMQLEQECLAISAAHGTPKPLLMRGRGEFASEAACLEAIETESEKVGKSIKGWLDTTKTFWLDELADACPSAPISQLSLVSAVAESTDAGHKAYLEQRVSADKEKIILCTHATLIIDAWSKLKNGAMKKVQSKTLTERIDKIIARSQQGDGCLGNYRYLLIDEAHQLEGIANNLASVSVSMREMALLSGGKGAKEIKATFAAMQTKNTHAAKDSYLNRNHAGDIQALLPHLARLKTNKGATQSSQRRYSQFEYFANSWLKGGRSNRLVLRVSPQRRWPSLEGSQSYQRDLLGFILRRPCGAALYSATLYTPTKRKGLTADPVIKGLGLIDYSLSHGIDKAVASLEPQKPAWIYEPVTAHVDTELLPPKLLTADGGAEINAWHKALAMRVRKIAHQASGGTLVLCNSYATLNALGSLLRTTEVGERVLIGSELTHFPQMKAQYKDAYKKGERPVWLATGRAWTGVDLSDHDSPAGEDHLLSDLVITRLPFASPIHGESEFDYRDKTHQCLMKLNQGAGRLVRRKGSPDKNLWILDARAAPKTKLSNSKITWAIEKKLEDYSRKHFINNAFWSKG